MAFNMHLLFFYLIFVVLVFSDVECVLPPYIPSLGNNNLGRSDLIKRYCELGFHYKEIMLFLALYHGLQLSLRHLKRLIKNLGIKRRRDPSDLRDVFSAVDEELSKSGDMVGYRQMTQRLQVDHKLVVGRETVRELLKVCDPEGVERRSKHRLKRRRYVSKGPSYLWHMDGYDKLKPFGFCVHGCIDGFSRRIMWLEVSSTNNDPAVVAQYYVDCVKQLRGTARAVRADCGTENVNVAAIQRFLRSQHNDDMAGVASFMYGKSVSNQRIEAWWGILRKGCADWWIRYFKDMRDCGLYCDDNVIQRECLKFCFMAILREELYRVARLWNVHRIRPSSNMESPAGRPDFLFFLSEANEARDYKKPVAIQDLVIAEERCCKKLPPNGCDANFTELVTIIMEENDLVMPTNPEEAIILYAVLLEEIDNL